MGEKRKTTVYFGGTAHELWTERGLEVSYTGRTAVLAVGEGKLDKDGKLIPVPVKEGDKVLYGKYGGTEITVDGEDVMILRADDLYAVFA